jgi:D-alanine-D-alanine ligase
MLKTLPSNIHIWVLAPQLITADENLAYYYDFTQSIEEYKRSFAALGLPWQWQPVTMGTYREIIDTISNAAAGQLPVVFNLCDGDEVNGAPGISVIDYLEKKQIHYTGAGKNFYHLTTSKITMKQAFDAASVVHADWIGITNVNQLLQGTCAALGSPLIAKPAVSGGSMGLGTKNVVHTDEELAHIVQEIYKGYHGWDLAFGGIVAEKFIAGPEYTTLIVGHYQQREHAILYPPVERVFHKALKEEEKFLSFDRLWETYDDEKPIGDYEDFYNYYPPQTNELATAINELSWQAYCAVQGTGYGRVDVRMDSSTGKLYVLEVNAQCGLSEDENYTSIGAILRLNKSSFSQLVYEVLLQAFANDGN